MGDTAIMGGAELNNKSILNSTLNSTLNSALNGTLCAPKSCTQIVGILNITPDSFSDGGEAFTPCDAIKQAEIMLEAGADMLDVGAESTRPNAEIVTPTTEIARLKPVLAEIMAMAQRYGATVSLDTRNAQTAEFGLDHGIAWVNDVSGAANEDLLKIVAQSDAKYVLMHSLGVPANPKIILPNDDNLIDEVTSFFKRNVEYLQYIGISKQRIIIDAGLGFGKCAAGSLRLMLASAQLQHDIGCDMMVGHSRKSMFKLLMLKMLGAQDMQTRNALTLLASSFLATQKIAYLRVHDVTSHVDLLKNVNLLKI